MFRVTNESGEPYDADLNELVERRAPNDPIEQARLLALVLQAVVLRVQVECPLVINDIMAILVH